MSDDQITAYNYTVFEGKEDFVGFREGTLRVGSKAPDCDVIVAQTGERLRLSDFWQEQDLLIEFGSLT